MAEEHKGGIGDGIRTGLGILTAIKEAIEETIEEAVERGDLSPDRAKAAMKNAAERAQSSFDQARDRLDFVGRRDFEALQAEVRELRRRLDARDGAAEQPEDPDSESGGIIVTD
jgi:polyhydroxyalkanoate synthesis regulator phasin